MISIKKPFIEHEGEYVCYCSADYFINYGSFQQENFTYWPHIEK